MRDVNVVDRNYFTLLDPKNSNDFYSFIIDQFNLKDDDQGEARDKAKKLFTKWVFGKGYTDGHSFYKIFPVASKFVESLKEHGYKRASSLMQRKESEIWIDDIMENIPINFALPIHDSVIVKSLDADKAFNWCKERHPEIVFTLKEL